MKRISLVVGVICILALSLRDHVDVNSAAIKRAESFCIAAIGSYDDAIREAKYIEEVAKHRAQYGW